MTETTVSTPTIDPLAALLRRFAVDLLTAQSWPVLPDIMASDYRLHIGGHVITGRDEQYRPAMELTFAQFPGLCVTVHDVLLGENAMAMRFTEHGASRRAQGRHAAWQGVSLFRVRDGRLEVGWAEEDYYSRKRHLDVGTCDAVEAPAPAPWDTESRPADSWAEDAMRRWLQDGAIFRTLHTRWAGEDLEPSSRALLDPQSVSIDDLFSAGGRVAFHATVTGAYHGGLAGIDTARIGARATLRLAGIVTVQGGAVQRAHVVSDRLGLQRSLQDRP
jgi:hypothetical protein